MRVSAILQDGTVLKTGEWSGARLNPSGYPSENGEVGVLMVDGTSYLFFLKSLVTEENVAEFVSVAKRSTKQIESITQEAEKRLTELSVLNSPQS